MTRLNISKSRVIKKKNNEFEKTYINPTINDNFYLIANTEYHNPID